jgi:hypothetical protein
MPTVFRVGSARFFFYSNENQEPPHVHVARCVFRKFWRPDSGNSGGLTRRPEAASQVSR